jgi:hypothetical protein
MSRSIRLVGLLAALAVASSACVVEESPPPPPPPDTEIGFNEIQNFGVGCGTVTSWSVTMRELGTTSQGGCGDEVVFGALAPGATYTFDLSGYAGGQLCFTGSCAVPTEGGIRTYGDCSAQIQHLCGN